MGKLIKGLSASLLVLALATPAAAESWARFSATDRTSYLIDLDTLAQVDGIATTVMAKVPRDASGADYTYETEQVFIRCSDGSSKGGTVSTYDATGTLVDSYTDAMEWERTLPGGVYASIKNMVCDNHQPTEGAHPTIVAYVFANQ